MIRTAAISCLVAALLVVGLGAVPAAAQKMHEDNAWGFKVKVPSGWREIPLKVNERWIIGKYQSDRAYVSEEGYNHKPEMKILVFPEAAKGEASHQKVEQDGETIKVQLKHRYKDYQAYLKDNFSGGGYFFSKEEEGKLGDIKVSMYEVKVEKLSYVGKQRLIAWVFHLPDADIAISFDLLENRYNKLRSTCLSSLKAFELAERTGEAKQKETTALEIPTPEKWEKMTPLERMKNRKDRTEKFIQRAIAALPDGWKSKSSDHFEVLTHADARFTKKMTDQAEAIRDWLDKTWYELGDDYVPRAVLRICLDTAEENAYTQGSTDSWNLDWETREIVVSKRTEYGRDVELEHLSRNVCSHWFYNRNLLLSGYTPWWFRYGIGQYVGTAVAKGKRLKFDPDSWERDALRKGEREGKLVANRDILKMTAKEYNKALSETGGVIVYQSASLIRYLMSPRCRRDKRTKDILIKYLLNLNAIAKDIYAKERKESKAKGEKAKTAKEEREMRKKQQEEDQKQARYIADEAFKRTFGDWNDKDWDRLEKGWKKAAL